MLCGPYLLIMNVQCNNNIIMYVRICFILIRVLPRYKCTYRVLYTWVPIHNGIIVLIRIDPKVVFSFWVFCKSVFCQGTLHSKTHFIYYIIPLFKKCIFRITILNTMMIYDNTNFRLMYFWRKNGLLYNR